MTAARPRRRSVQDLAQPHQLRLAAAVVDAIVVGNEQHLAAGQHRQALDLLQHRTLGGPQVGHQVAHQRLGQRAAGRHAGQVDAVEALDAGVRAVLVVALDHQEAVVAERGDFRQPHPAAVGRGRRVQRVEMA